MARVDDAHFVTARNEQQRSVRRGHVIQEDGNVHGPRFRHFVVPLPGAVVLVPLPDFAVKCRFGVDFVLVHVDATAENLFDRLDQPWVGAQPTEAVLVTVGGQRAPGDP